MKGIALSILAALSPRPQEVPVTPPAQQEVGRGEFQARLLESDPDEIVYLATGLQFERGDLRVSARHLVLWLDPDEYRRAIEEGGDLRRPPSPPPSPQPSPAEGVAARAAAMPDFPSVLLGLVREIYAEGEVAFTKGSEVSARAHRLYLDLSTGRGILVEPEIRATASVGNRPVPLVVRASSLRREATGAFLGRDAAFTSCPYGEPHYHVAAEEIALRETAERSFEVAGRGTSLVVGETAVLRLPTWRVDAGDRDWFPIRDLNLGYSSNDGPSGLVEFGNDVRAPGEALNRALGLEEGRFEGDWRTEVGYRGERGPSADVRLQWETKGVYRGELRGFALQDDGEDEGPFSDVYERTEHSRGRVRFGQRILLGEGTNLDTEVSYESDANVLPEFFLREFREEKAPETFAYLRHATGSLALSLLGKWRINDFDPVPPEGYPLSEPPPGPPVEPPSLIEALPLASARALVLPLPPLPLPAGLGERADDPLVPYLSARVEGGDLRRRFTDADFDPSVPPFADGDDVRAARFDVIQRLEIPWRAGPVTIAPFGGARYTTWSEDAAGDGGTGRFAAEAGASAFLHLERDFGSVRHLVDPIVRYFNRFAVTRAPAELIPFDGTESLEEVEFVRFDLRNRLARRGGGTLADLLVGVSYFPDDERDNAGKSFGDVGFDLTVSPFPSEAEPSRAPWFHAMGTWDHTIDRFDTFDAAVHAPSEAGPTWIVGYNEGREIQTGDLRYAAVYVGGVVQAGEKWDVEAVEQYDFHREETLENRLTLRRIGHDWIFEISTFFDTSGRNEGVSVRVRPALLFDRARASGDTRRPRALLRGAAPYSGAY
jgi:hypothetical protein